ncbi:MAG: RNA 2',3'-cyclic phosphodiesterase [archaeon]
MVKLFVAMDLPSEVKDYMYDLQKKLKTPAAKIKFVNKKHFHLTVKFLGDVDESKVPGIVERLSRLKNEVVKVRLSGLGFFPSEKDPRVIWIGMAPEDRLERVAQDVDGELLDLFPDEQKFSPHLTLGRVKTVRKREEFLKKVEEVEVEPLEFEFSWLKLYESVRKGSVQKYVCLKEF